MLHQVKIFDIKIEYFDKNLLSTRRDKVFCHECRFCCTLSVCTNKDGTYFINSPDKPLNGSKNKVFIISIK